VKLLVKGETMKFFIALTLFLAFNVAHADQWLCGTLGKRYIFGCQPGDHSCSNPNGTREQLNLAVDNTSEQVDVSPATAEVDRFVAQHGGQHVCLYGEFTRDNWFYVSQAH
jgi:hypothetical protein